MQFTSTVLAALAAVASAQKVQVVTVSSSNNSLVYSPDNIKAAAGDMVQFQFVGGNHTVTQSTFDSPCSPIHNVESNVTGFHSGFMPAKASEASGMIPTYTIKVNNTSPMWVYCAQGRHCQEGMVMVINENTSANSSRSLNNFKELAAKQSTTVEPSTGSTGGSSGSESSNGTTGTGTGTGSGTGSGSGNGNGNGEGNGNGGKPGGTTTAGSGMVKVGSTLGLVAAAAAVMLV